MKKNIHIIFWALFLVFWELCGYFKILPEYIIPTPLEILKAIFTNYDLLLKHSKITLIETFLGLFFGILGAFIFAVLMRSFDIIYKIIYPFFIILQSIPTIAIAPILILWLGYDMLPKIVLIAITTIFPMLINIIDGFNSSKNDYITLLKTMNANNYQIMRFYVLPNTLPYFFAGLRISVSYAYISAVVAEWLGGFNGLGVYMLQAKKLFEYDLMFAVIVLVSVISLGSVKIIKLIENKICKGG